jgi:hypothetical protein
MIVEPPSLNSSVSPSLLLLSVLLKLTFVSSAPSISAIFLVPRPPLLFTDVELTLEMAELGGDDNKCEILFSKLAVVLRGFKYIWRSNRYMLLDFFTDG